MMPINVKLGLLALIMVRLTDIIHSQPSLMIMHHRILPIHQRYLAPTRSWTGLIRLLDLAMTKPSKTFLMTMMILDKAILLYHVIFRLVATPQPRSYKTAVMPK